MPAVSTRTALTDMYRTVFVGKDLTNMSKRKTPLGDKIPKKADFVGDSMTIPFNQGMNWGIHPTLTSTEPVGKAGNFKKWVVPDTNQLYGKLYIDSLSMMRSEKEVGAWLKLRVKETEDILDNMKMARLGWQLWDDGSNSIGRVASVTGSDPVTTITLTSFNDAVKFDAGGKQVLQFNPNLTGNAGTLKSSQYQVDKVNRYNSSGNTVLTVTRFTGAGAGNDPAANDYIYNRGFYDQGYKGISAWIPAADPSATPFFGMDRSDEPQMKAGWRGQWRGTISGSAEELVSIMGQYFDPEFSAFWLSNYRWFQLKEELTAQGRFYVDETKSLEFGTTALKMYTPGGSVNIMADPYCPNDSGFLLRHDDLELHSTGPLIHVVDDDGLTALRLSDADGIEIRYRSAAQLIVPRPFRSGRFPITSS